MKKNILIFTDYYLPAFKAGGPITTLSNMINNLQAYFNFFLVTRNHDLGEKKIELKGIQSDVWNELGTTKILYSSPNRMTIKTIKEILNELNYDIIYLNSFFSFKFTIKILLLRKLRAIPKILFILAPRGELDKNALNYKKYKKFIFLRISKLLNLYKNIIWQASSEFEKLDIKKQFGKKSVVLIAPDLVDNRIICQKKDIQKEVGKLNLLFLSRVHRTKNLKYALSVIKNFNNMVKFNIYGPIEDEKYWEECLEIIKALPSNIKVNYKGIIEKNKIVESFSNNHVLFFPTENENFGHVIFESFAHGMPVITSNNTPWRNLNEIKVGFDLPLDDPKKFVEAIERFINMDNIEYKKWANNAINYAKQIANNKRIIESNINLFQSTLSSK